MGRALLLAGSLLTWIHPSPARAQATYGSLSTLKPNHWIRVEKLDDTRIEGRFLEVKVDSLYLRPDSSQVAIAMASVARIDERGHATGKGAWIGLVVGAATGALVGAASSQEGDFFGPGASAVAGGIVFGFVGTGVGTIVGAVTHHWHRRYQAAEEAPAGD